MMGQIQKGLSRHMVVLALCLWFMTGMTVLAAEDDTLDYGQIQEAMDEMLPESVDISFSELVGRLVGGDVQGVAENLKDYLMDQLFYEIKSNKAMLVQMLGIVFISAVFTNFSMAFSKTFVAETGFYLTYMVLFSLLLTSFMTAGQMAAELMGNMLKFMSALVPVFCLSVTLTGNIQTGIWYQQAMVTGITLIEWLVSRFNPDTDSYVCAHISRKSAFKRRFPFKSADLMKTIAGMVSENGSRCHSRPEFYTEPGHAGF